MQLARWERTIVDSAGNVIPSPFVEVRKEIAGAPLAVLYEDREGADGLGNPFQVATLDGKAFFHCEGGPHRIDITAAGFTQTLRWVGIGTAGEHDFGTVFRPTGAWSGATTYDIGDVVSKANGGPTYAFVSNEDDNLNHSPSFTGTDPNSDAHWTVLGLITSPGEPGEDGEPGSSDVVGTATDSIAIGTGVKTFNIAEPDRGWGIGARLRATSNANPTTHFMEGVITDYAADVLELTVDLAQGGGSRADWTFNIAGEPGADELNVRVITAAGAVAVAVDDEIILLNKTVGQATNVNFPAANTYTGRGVTIKDIKGDAQTNNATPVFNGAETCDGEAGSVFVIAVNYGEAGVFRPLPSGAGWYLLTR